MYRISVDRETFTYKQTCTSCLNTSTCTYKHFFFLFSEPPGPYTLIFLQCNFNQKKLQADKQKPICTLYKNLLLRSNFLGSSYMHITICHFIHPSLCGDQVALKLMQQRECLLSSSDYSHGESGEVP